jgi:glycine C-acetyltransferase
VIAAAANKVMDIISATTERRDKLEKLTAYFRREMTDRGFDIVPGFHPIVPIMLYNARLSQDMARDLYYEGIYVIGFFYPVVPKGQARIRTQISAAHDMKHMEKAVEAFARVGEKYKILGKSKDEVIAMYGE